MNKLFYFLLAGFLLGACSHPEKATEEKKLLLPVMGEKHPSTAAGTDTVYHTVGHFSLTDQNRETVTDQTVNGKIYVADFFFATCQSICPQMSTQLIRVQDAFKSDNDFMILSHTVNPAHDSVEVLSAYAGKYSAIKGKWHFLTGSKKTIYDLAKNDYLVNALEEDGTPEGFLHSELFLLIDKAKRIRGMYDGTDSVQVNKLISDIKLLKTEK